MEIAETHPLVGQPIEIRRLDFRAETADVGKTHVVDDDHQDIGPFIGRPARRRLFFGTGGKQRERNNCSYANHGVQMPALNPGAQKAPEPWNPGLPYHEYLAVSPYMIGGA
jgi:hypothetical protein